MDSRIKMLVVAESPTAECFKNGSVLSDSEMFNTALNEVVKVNSDEVKCVYLLNEFLTDKPTKKRVDVAVQEIIPIIEQYNPKVILALGEVVTKALTGVKTLKPNKGKLLKISVTPENIQVLPTYSPYYIERNENLLEAWVNDIYKAWQTANGVVQSVSSTKVVYCDTFDKISTCVEYIQKAGVASFDFETCTIDALKGTFHKDFYATTLAFTFQAGSAYVIPLQHKESPYTLEEVREIMSYLKTEVFENPKVRKIGHNLNFDFHVCRRYGITKLRGRIDDTMLMAHLHDETTRRGLKELTIRYFPDFAGYENELENVAWEGIPLSSLVQYNGTDTDLTYRLCVTFESYLLQDKPSYITYRNLTMALFRPLWEAEARGMLIDRDFLSESIKEVDGYIKEQIKKLRSNKYVKRYEHAMRTQKTEEAIYETQQRLAKWRETHHKMSKTEQNLIQRLNDLKSGVISGYDAFSFASPKQLQDLLYFSEFGFKFKTFQYSTGKDVLKELKPQDDTGFIDELLKLRSMEKMQGTYLKGIYERIDENDRLHTSFKIDGTTSGRLSSKNPNLQNMPNAYKLKDELSRSIVKKVKKSFSVPEGYTLIQIDVAQAELRIIASFADETNMLEVYNSGGDLHKTTAAGVKHLTLEEFEGLPPADQKLFRSQAKAVNFGFIYGISAEGFRDYAKNGYDIEYTLEEAEQTRSAFFKTYPKLLDYHAEYIEKGRKFGWVRTLFGRRRRVPDIHSNEGGKRSADERVCVNSPIQGTAGEYTEFMMSILYLRITNKRWQMVNTIHDSIMFYIPSEDLHEAVKFILNTCENLPTMQYFGKELKLKLKLDAEASTESWADLAEL